MPDLLIEVEAAMRKVAAYAADAVQRYAKVSGMGPGYDMPETFITSFVFDRLGNEYAMTLETNATKLLARDAETRRRSAVEVSDEAGKLDAKIGQLDSRKRVDLVLYRDSGESPSQRPFLALVEFKLWHKW